MAKLVVKSKHKIDTCQREIDIVRAQAIDAFLDSVVNTIWRIYVLVWSKIKTIFTLSSWVLHLHFESETWIGFFCDPNLLSRWDNSRTTFTAKMSMKLIIAHDRATHLRTYYDHTYYNFLLKDHIRSLNYVDHWTHNWYLGSFGLLMSLDISKQFLEIWTIVLQVFFSSFHVAIII